MSPTKSVPQEGFRNIGGGGGVVVLKTEQLQRNSVHSGSQNSTQFRFVSPQKQTQSRTHIQNQAQVEKEEKMPSFEFGIVLKDVVSRLNSSKFDVSMKSTSTPSCVDNHAPSTIGASGLPIPTLNLSPLRGSIFSQASSEASNSIFSPNFRKNSEHNNIILTMT